MWLAILGVGLGSWWLLSGDKGSSGKSTPTVDGDPKRRIAARVFLQAWASRNRTKYGDPPGGPYTFTPATIGGPWNDRDRWVLSQFQRQEAPTGTRTDGELDEASARAVGQWAIANLAPVAPGVGP